MAPALASVSCETRKKRKKTCSRDSAGLLTGPGKCLEEKKVIGGIVSGEFFFPIFTLRQGMH